ncbi:MAG: hypothetical protein HC824_16625 [Synechococcales cyanobacterium RM1_1_8]|nr:hypothetical protein [Synechococcales cyanobacterium RM1_1_8]
MGRKQPGRKQPFKHWSRLGLLSGLGLGMASGAIATPTAASGLTPGLTQASHSQASHSQASHSQTSHSPAIAQAPSPTGPS